MKIIEIVSDPDDVELITGFARSQELSWWSISDPETGRQSAIRLLVPGDKRQIVEDNLQSLLELKEGAFATVQPVDAVLPRITTEEPAREHKKILANLTREELYQQAELASHLDSNYLLLAVLSTVVATIGLLEANIAVIIGAMVIAPLLGPNIALALGTTLGDTQLILRALKTGFAGIGIALVMSIVIGFIWTADLSNPELMSRTQVGFDSIALALASGAAAILSITTGLSSVLVGVMVAVALLPPLATAGIMVGSGHGVLAFNASLLLVVNIVCVNLAAKIVFLTRGVAPRTWYEQQSARKRLPLRIGIWVFSLALLALIILFQNSQVSLN